MRVCACVRVRVCVWMGGGGLYLQSLLIYEWPSNVYPKEV